MKITIDTECTPEEARRFLGLPDLSPVHDAYVAKMQRMIEEGVQSGDIESFLRNWSYKSLRLLIQLPSSAS